MKMKNTALTPAMVEQALMSPTSVFDHPTEVVGSQQLSRDQKLQILKLWESDAQSLERATDENMSGGEQPQLDEINRALSELEGHK